jgi:hypothetical protein
VIEVFGFDRERLADLWRDLGPSVDLLGSP